MSFSRWSSRPALAAGAIILLLGSSLSQYQYDSWKKSAPKINTTYNIYIEPQPLHGLAAQIASFGNREFLANIYWLELIQYYGGGDPYGKYRKLPELFDTITDLSPKFLYAYQSGLVILPGEGFPDQAIGLAEKGKRNLPDAWEIPYYEGLVYHIYKKDYAMAAQEFQLAAKIPGAPTSTQYFAGIYFNEANNPQTAYQIFQNIAATTTDPFLKDRASRYVAHLQIIFALQNAVQTFQQKYHRLPTSLQELVDKKLIDQMPTDPLNIELEYNPQTGAISEGKAIN